MRRLLALVVGALVLVPTAAAADDRLLLQSGFGPLVADADARTIDLLVDDAELERRKASWKLPEPRYTTGVLAKFAKLVTGAERGAVTEP